jgi:soluble lytic murein transglycosylase
MSRQALRVVVVTVTLVAVWPAALRWAPPAQPAPGTLSADTARAEPTPTAHPPVPRDLSALWLVPDARPVPPRLLKNFARGLDLIAEEDFAAARPLVAAPALARTPVADYARYYTALVDLREGEAVRARTAFHALVASRPAGVLGEWALLGEASAAELAGDMAGAAMLYQSLLAAKPEQPDAVMLGLARTLAASGNRTRAAEVYGELFYGHPVSELAGEARTQLLALSGGTPAADPARDLARAEALFAARRYAEAQAALEALRPRSGDEKELVALRLAECDHYLGRHRQALAALRPYLSGAKREAEARFFHLTATRAAGDHAGYVAAARAFAKEFPTGAWTEETLNNLATHYIVTDDDPSAEAVFAEYLERFPRGKYGARASWRLGWWRFRAEDFASAAEIFDRGAVHFPRSDYRPAWLYWSGRAYAKLRQTDMAEKRFALVRTDYLHSYYGRLASAHAGAEPVRRSTVGETARASTAAVAVPSDLPPNAAAIRQLIVAGAVPLAEAEVRYAQRRFGPTPALEATRAWLLRERGEYRPAINAMKRAYPQYMTQDGDRLPLEARKVIFPLDYWTLIKRHADRRGLDPYLIAALVAQESSFDPEVRSAANAYGLMQIVPATGRRLARSLGIRRFSTGKLTDPETNVKLGTFYFKGLVNQFGGAHFALASYNAGENRVERWIAERGPMPQDEFIDDIPFPETQLYVKKILGTAEDYRQLYGERHAAAN